MTSKPARGSAFQRLVVTEGADPEVAPAAQQPRGPGQSHGVVDAGGQLPDAQRPKARAANGAGAVLLAEHPCVELQRYPVSPLEVAAERVLQSARVGALDGLCVGPALRGSLTDNARGLNHSSM